MAEAQNDKSESPLLPDLNTLPPFTIVIVMFDDE